MTEQLTFNFIEQCPWLPGRSGTVVPQASCAAAARVIARALARLIALVVLAAPVNAHAIEISYQFHWLSDRGEGIDRAGRLIYRGGLRLFSPDPRFGGWSGLVVSADGKRLLTQSDQAHWLRTDIVYDRHGDLAGLKNAELADMRDLGFPEFFCKNCR